LFGLIGMGGICDPMNNIRKEYNKKQVQV